MLKRYYALCFALCVIFSFSITLFAADSLKSIKTPRGKQIPDCYERDEFERFEDITFYNNQYDLLYSNDEVISNSSQKYNCHGYAWHMIGDNCQTDFVWMGLYNPAQIDSYWVDESYSEVDPSYAEEYENQIIIDYTGDHSAVATHETDIFLSKWGKGPLMRHYKNNVPHRINELFRLVCLSCLLLH